MMAVTGLATAAHAGPKTYKISESGSFFSGIQQQGFSELVTSDLAITAGKGSGLGQTSTQARFVWDFSSIKDNPDPDLTTYPQMMPLSCNDPNSNPPFLSQGGNFVLRVESRGDLLFGAADCNVSTNKFNGETGQFKLHIEGTITGGTGKFAGATGTFVTESTGAVLPGPGGYFGYVVSEGAITINSP
jgi:hypothetical protein